MAARGKKKEDNSNEDKGSLNWTQIIVAVIGLTGVIVAAIISRSPTTHQSTQAPTDNVASAKSRRVLLDIYHGQPIVDIGSYSTWNLGFEFEELQTPLTAEILRSYDIYLLYLPRYTGNQHPLTFDELTTIRNYIDSGGNVFLIGLGWVWTDDNPNQEYPLNIIAKGYGIEFTSDFINTVNGVHYKESPIAFDISTMKEHPITKGIKQIGAALSAPGTLDVSSPAIPLIWGKNTNARATEPVILAAVELPNNGKLVTLQHSNYIRPFDISQYENQKFPDIYDNLELFQNILDWLAN